MSKWPLEYLTVIQTCHDLCPCPAASREQSIIDLFPSPVSLITDFLSLSWLTCVCCNFLCLGTMAVLSASQSKTLAESGNLELAAKRGQDAKKMAVHGICFTMIIWLIVLVVLVYQYVVFDNSWLLIAHIYDSEYSYTQRSIPWDVRNCAYSIRRCETLSSYCTMHIVHHAFFFLDSSF